jgi:P27 family predicted phage terminase small subunit
MAKTGRPAAPTHLKVLRGDREDRINRKAPTPSESTVRPPIALSSGAREVWDRLAPDLIDKRVLTAWDIDLFMVFCEATARFYECSRQLDAELVTTGSAKSPIKSPYWQILRDCEAMMSRVGGRFGLTPADRSSLAVRAQQDPKLGGERLIN